MFNSIFQFAPTCSVLPHHSISQQSGDKYYVDIIVFIFKSLLFLGAVSLNQLLGQDIINTTVTLTVQAADGGNPFCTKTQEISVTIVDSCVR